jgi:hypothetical protein
MITDSVLEATRLLDKKGLADFISQEWDCLKGQRSGREAEWTELRNYVFATDTRSTSNAALPWKNSTTIPKLCQIRDNLHANYMAAVFPNDNFFRWEAYTKEAAEKRKEEAIQAYISNKVRESGFRETVSNLIYDYIDYGTPVSDVIWVDNRKEDAETGEVVQGYVGPKLIRVSPLDHVFDASAVDYTSSWNITRSIRRFGEFELEAKNNPDQWITEALDYARNTRSHLSGFSKDDFDKASAYAVDGFGSLFEYYGSGFVELLEFEGTVHDPLTGELLDDYIITVIDRNQVIRKEPIPAWKRGGYKAMVGWRPRPDNLYAMGPLDNLVGMQYRLDHLQNLAADIKDLTAAPPLVIKGELSEAVEWAPFSEWHMEPDGDVRPLFTGSDLAGVEREMTAILTLMEEMAGAPKQAMGIRTPGEKTAHEVQSLDNAAGRIFQEKITQFELAIIEPALNSFLETAVYNMNGPDIIRVMDDDLGVAEFLQITKEDITARGKLRPIGARHFASQAQLVQNLTGLANSPIWAKIETHISDKKLAKLFEETLQLDRFDLVSDNAGLMDKIDSQRLMQQGQEDLAVEQQTPLEGDSEIGENQAPVV